MGSFYRSKHELVFVFKVGTAPHINNVELGQHGRYRTNVWNYAGVNTFGASARRRARHAPDGEAGGAGRRRDPGLLAPRRHRARAFARQRHDAVAADKTGRRGYGIELDPRLLRRHRASPGGPRPGGGARRDRAQLRRHRRGRQAARSEPAAMAEEVLP